MSIEAFLKKVEIDANPAYSEAQFQHLFLNLFANLITEKGLISNIKIEETIVKGKADARIGYIVFEFEKPEKLDSSKERKKTVDELKDHLKQYVTKGIRADSLKGIATDGKWIATISFDEHSQDFILVDEFNSPIDFIDAFYAIRDSAVLIDRLIMGVSKRELSPENLIDEFGPKRPICKLCVPTLWNALDKGLKTPRTQAFYEQWKVLFSLSTRKVITGKELKQTLDDYGLNDSLVKDEEDVRKFLFVIHTYYSILLKFLAFAIADEIKILGSLSLLKQIEQNAITGLETAEVSFPKLAFNVVEKDVFSWFQDAWSDELVGIIHSFSIKMKNYDVQGIKKDVLKRVYQFLIPSQLRKSLGEFYTKDWAADMLLDAIGYEGEGKILDPACGSGTFLVSSIERVKKRFRKETPSVVLNKIISSVIGFDINPIAVMTARVNYLLSILDVMRGNPGGINIPVYLCDSVVIPKESYDIPSTSQIYTIQTQVKEFKIPKDKSAMQILRILGKDANVELEFFMKDVEHELGKSLVLKYQRTLELHEKVTNLEKNKTNGIWCRLIENFFASILSGQFDYVVGNPPWVAPERVPK